MNHCYPFSTTLHAKKMFLQGAENGRKIRTIPYFFIKKSYLCTRFSLKTKNFKYLIIIIIW